MFFAVKQATAGFKYNFQPGQIATKLTSHQEEGESPPRHEPDDRDETSIEREEERMRVGACPLVGLLVSL